MQEADDLLEVLPIEESIRDIVTILEESADIIVLLTHEDPGYDRYLAPGLPGVDIIFGGHAHALRRWLGTVQGGHGHGPCVGASCYL